MPLQREAADGQYPSVLEPSSFRDACEAEVALQLIATVPEPCMDAQHAHRQQGPSFTILYLPKYGVRSTAVAIQPVPVSTPGSTGGQTSRRYHDTRGNETTGK